MREQFIKKLKNLTSEEINIINQKSLDDYNKQHTLFKKNYNKNHCYLCDKPFKTISKKSPCLHWLLREGKFKPKDFSLLYQKYDYHQFASYLRWVANEECPIKNINDLTEEQTKGKIIEYTIKWKNIEWSFDCLINDFTGHVDTRQNFPHYHFQMRIDNRQFINYNQHHLPFSNSDIDKITMSMDDSLPFIHSFGHSGSSMQDLMNTDPEYLYDNLAATGSCNGILDLSTIITANNEEGIPGELISNAYQESKTTGIPISKIIQDRLSKSDAKIITIMSPSEDVPQIAKRTPHKPR